MALSWLYRQSLKYLVLLMAWLDCVDDDLAVIGRTILLLSSNCGLNLPIMMRGGAGAASTATQLQSPSPGRLCRGKTKISDEAGTFTTAVIVRDGPQQKSTLCNYIMK